jgi:hypothetical protein
MGVDHVTDRLRRDRGYTGAQALAFANAATISTATSYQGRNSSLAIARGFGPPPKRMLCRIATFQQRVPEKNGARMPRMWIFHNLELTFKSVFGF